MTSFLEHLKNLPLQLKLFRENPTSTSLAKSQQKKNKVPTRLLFRSLFDINHEKKSRKTRAPRKRKPQVSDPALKEIWNSLIADYFPTAEHLRNYTVVWSKRNQIRTLASCSLERKRIVVAKELRFVEHDKWLSPLLYHEMCHAYLEYSILNKSGKTPWHGPQFKKLESRHPLIPSFNEWVNQGGWAKAVRSHRAKAAHEKRKEKLSAAA